MWIREYTLGYGRVGVDVRTGACVYILVRNQGRGPLRDLVCREETRAILLATARAALGV